MVQGSEQEPGLKQGEDFQAELLAWGRQEGSQSVRQRSKASALEACVPEALIQGAGI